MALYSLKNLFLFNGLSKEKIESVISSLPDAVTFKKGEEIYSQNEFRRALGVIVSGSAEAFNGDLLKRTFGEGDVFGAAALFCSDSSYVSRITAKTDCTIRFIGEDTLTAMTEQYPVIAKNYIAFLSDRVRFLNKKIELFTCKGAAARLYRYLSENADPAGIVEIKNMARLARLTSIGRTSLYRAVDELIGAGVIEKNGTQFIIK